MKLIFIDVRFMKMIVKPLFQSFIIITPSAPIHAHPLSGLQAGGRRLDANNRRNAVFTGNDRTVGHHAADLHDQAAGNQEKRRPGRIRPGADENLAGVNWVRLRQVKPTRTLPSTTPGETGSPMIVFSSPPVERTPS